MHLELKIPARTSSQGETLLVLQPGASARLEESKSGLPDTESRTRVVALSDGVELYDVDDEIASAFIEQADGGAIAGLAGAGAASGAGGGRVDVRRRIGDRRRRAGAGGQRRG